MITQERLRELLDYDPVTGFFTRRVRTSNRIKVGQVAGGNRICNGRPYRVICLEGKSYFAHRLAWLYVHGEWPDYIDHMNGQGRVNAIENLRDCSQTQNGANKVRPLNNTSGFKGVTFDRQRNQWRSQIQFKRKHKTLGLFDRVEDAARAYDSEALRLFGMFAKTNQMMGLLE